MTRDSTHDLHDVGWLRSVLSTVTPLLCVLSASACARERSRPSRTLGVPVDFVPLPGQHGLGVKLSTCVEPEALQEAGLLQRVLEALDEHGLVVLQTTAPASASQLDAFATGLLGPNSLVDFSGCDANARNQGGGGSKCHAPGVPTVRVLGNKTDASGQPTSLLCRMGYEWHNDGVGPGVISILQCLATPSCGGETLFASSSALYAALSAEQKAIADAAILVCSNKYTGGGPAAVDAECGLRMDPTGTKRIRPAETTRPGWTLNESTTPLVMKHAHSGKPVIVQGGKNLDHIKGMDAEASAELLSSLLCTGLKPQHVTPLDEDLYATGKTSFAPEAVLEFKWAPGTIVVWDNQAMLHSTTPVVLYGPGERLFFHIIGTDQRHLGEHADTGGGDYGKNQRDAFFLGARATE